MDDERRRPRDVARWAVVQLSLAGFVAAVAGVTVAISKELGWGDRPPVVALLIAAGVVTIALPRVRPAAERLANGLVLRDRADAYGLVSEFVRSAAGTLPIEEVLPRLAETAARSVRSPRGEVRVWLADGGQWQEAWPVSRPEGLAAVNVDVRHEGLAIGELEVSLTDEEGDDDHARRRLEALAGPAGLALSTVRLTVDLRLRADELARTETELRASQRRLIEARLDEREEFVRAVDGFVSPHLAEASRALAEAGVARPEDVESELVAAARSGEVALEHLRSLAHGVFPVVLLQAGLAEALLGWADESGFALTVEGATDPGFAQRAPAAAAIEYFACVEALQGLRPPSHAALVELSDGAGTATMAIDWAASSASRLDSATALRLKDRAEAVGGTLEVMPTGLHLRVATGALR